ncbi:adenylyltransferase/cytidyltransferase family protein [Candidatus Woesearchaeota archaeon]|nr:adenylyltransferase/cytidyltransferase family protein [Candidatus Woesearchaeota archaeon]MCF8013127.1 adenylyltransferase/cytidyltransferase family protein [Candidatus Woesearchaeota archaeon]
MLAVENIELYSSKKIISLKKCSEKINLLKKQGKKIGLCHGGFDLTHPGHFKHFEIAKSQCDYLVVSVTADEFVTSRKGLGRPIYTDKLRAYIIASHQSVDYVVISPFKKGTEIIHELKPSYYIKGPDFINKTTPGIISERKAIKDIGGEMKYTTEPPLSTTKIIQYIKNDIKNEDVLLLIDRDGTLIEDSGFFGKEKTWKKDLKLKENIINTIIYLQTKFKTTNIVISNQAGVARGYFTCKTVEEINKNIDDKLLSKNIIILNWQYCPDVDNDYAKTKPEINWVNKHIKEKTDRKPSIRMVSKGLEEINKKINDFDKIIVLGDSKDDELLADNLKATFLDANKEYDELIKEIGKNN